MKHFISAMTVIAVSLMIMLTASCRMPELRGSTDQSSRNNVQSGGDLYSNASSSDVGSDTKTSYYSCDFSLCLADASYRSFTPVKTSALPDRAGVDIACYWVLPTNESDLSNVDYRDLWKKFLSASLGVNGAPELGKGETPNPKTGFRLTVVTEEGEMTETVLSPSDIDEHISEYIEMYLYDDVNHPSGSWYSHLTEEEMTDETIISSVKLTTGKLSHLVKSVKLEAFIYIEDETPNGEYNGDNIRSVIIK